MAKKILILLLLAGMVQQAAAQLDRYKYIVVPLQFDGFKSVNQYQTSTLIKHLFVQEGFTAVYDDVLPTDLGADPCKGLRTRLLDNSSMLQTRVRLALVDCYGRVVFETAEGKSKEKDYKRAYREAIQEAFLSLQGIDYAYTPKDNGGEDPLMLPLGNDVKALPEPSTPPSPPLEAAPLAVEAVADPERVEPESEPELWYAQPLEDGYQLVDSSPRVRMKLLKTTREDTFIAMVEGAPQGMVYQKDGAWWHEFYEDGKPRLTKLRIKF